MENSRSLIQGQPVDSRQLCHEQVLCTVETQLSVTLPTLSGESLLLIPGMHWCSTSLRHLFGESKTVDSKRIPISGNNLLTLVVWRVILCVIYRLLRVDSQIVLMIHLGQVPCSLFGSFLQGQLFPLQRADTDQLQLSLLLNSEQQLNPSDGKSELVNYLVRLFPWSCQKLLLMLLRGWWSSALWPWSAFITGLAHTPQPCLALGGLSERGTS